ncbi:hypothetical protein CQW49_15855 [Methylosinus trichosporium OB3b]|uniref:Uncharacterized protein n=1 Tax=Methylosinus trichosporium (strain ATCC 35070 / NCIMB 11131 / UNIQEM 75 / OB3b) TaxID=595536 RepID=A0A2D2D2F2_METT3|nr:hypothetical protein CQW49_15855 [Methylosinus trichosporium OB3b]OBS53614.1 hypothetical protein A8B73_05310 [Methylosinus sp. 3S-1]
MNMILAAASGSSGRSRTSDRQHGQLSLSVRDREHSAMRCSTRSRSITAFARRCASIASEPAFEARLTEVTRSFATIGGD